jgi:putative acetyltransferase
MPTDFAVRVRPEEPRDADAIDRVVADAFLAEFGSTSEASLVRTMRARGELVADLTLVVVLGDEIVGHLAMSEVTVDGRDARGLGLAPVAVTPQRQGIGIGSTLIRAALARAEQAGWRFVVLLGHEHYYPRFGFEPARRYGLTGDYGDHDGWMVRPLGEHRVPHGHARYCSAFHD